MYGTAEVGCIAYESKNNHNEVNEGMIVEENIILEIVKPGSNQQVKKGEVGEVVITKLNSSYGSCKKTISSGAEAHTRTSRRSECY